MIPRALLVTLPTARITSALIILYGEQREIYGVIMQINTQPAGEATLAATSSRSRAEELRLFLMERRAAVGRESVGLPSKMRGRGRKAAGLSQGDLDELTGRSAGEYNRFETGKKKDHSQEYLTSVARVLRLSEQEWATLWRLTKLQKPPHPLRSDAGQTVPGMWRDVIESTGGGVMAYLNDSSWNLLAWNDHFVDLFPGRKLPTNTMRWMLLDREARENTLTDWSTRWAPLVIPQLQHAVRLRGHDEVLRQLESDALEDPVVGPLYREHMDAAIPYPDGSDRPLRHAVLGPGWVSTCVAEPVTSPGARLMMLCFKPGAQPERHPPLCVSPATEAASRI